MKRLIIGFVCVAVCAIGAMVLIVPDARVGGPTAAALAIATVPVPGVDMSSAAQAQAWESCQQDVGGGRLLEHRRGNTGLSEDRVLLYAWGNVVVRDHIGLWYDVRSYVDTLTGYSGNVVRTPFVCIVSEDFVVKSVTFEQIQFPQSARTSTK